MMTQNGCHYHHDHHYLNQKPDGLITNIIFSYLVGDLHDNRFCQSTCPERFQCPRQKRDIPVKYNWCLLNLQTIHDP